MSDKNGFYSNWLKHDPKIEAGPNGRHIFDF